MEREYESERRKMVERQIRARGIHNAAVLDAMAKVPRHRFVPDDMRAFAYADEPLPIGEGQTISQPYIVAYMTEALGVSGKDRVLEVGTGSGYQTAVLAELAAEVYTIEIVEGLSVRARDILEELGYKNIHFAVGDGGRGWPECAPFQAIMVTAAAVRIPEALERQLGQEGTLIAPVGTDVQDLVLVRNGKGGLARERLIPVRFVPLINVH